MKNVLFFDMETKKILASTNNWSISEEAMDGLKKTLLDAYKDDIKIDGTVWTKDLVAGGYECRIRPVLFTCILFIYSVLGLVFV